MKIQGGASHESTGHRRRGYIGSAAASALHDAGHEPIILDSLVKGRREFAVRFPFYEGDIADRALLETVFRDHPDIEATLHFAALIVVPESVAQPYRYYHENVVKSLELFRSLDELGCRRIVFSSSASIYGSAPDGGYRVTESTPHAPSSPYARTKHMMEMVLEDMCRPWGSEESHCGTSIPSAPIRRCERPL